MTGILSALDVRSIQRGLNSAGYDVGSVDGKFGTRTEKALSNYLSDKGLPKSTADSIAGSFRDSVAPKGVPSSQGPLQPQEAADRAKKADKAGAKAQDKFSPKKPTSKTACPKDPKCPPRGTLGSLSARYESGRRGSAAIGYDNTGGWSYGKYQIETKRGTMNGFLKYAESAAPETAKKLNDAGGYSAALAGKDTFKQAWGDLAQDPGFGDLQHDYIAQKNYDPLVDKVKVDTGLDVRSRSHAVKDAVWSVAVQHGPGSEVISRAFDGKDVAKMSDEQIIDAIYDERSAEKTNDQGEKVLKYFSKSTEDIQKGVRKRFSQERFCAKQMLAAENKPARLP